MTFRCVFVGDNDGTTGVRSTDAHSFWTRSASTHRSLRASALRGIGDLVPHESGDNCASKSVGWGCPALSAGWRPRGSVELTKLSPTAAIKGFGLGI